MKKQNAFYSLFLAALLLFITVVRVDAASLKVGTHWPAVDIQFVTIQAAIDAAGENDEIWVEQGTYTLSATINVSKSVSIYGGFTGSENERSDRSLSASLTIVDGNDSVSCFLVTSMVTIDGFTITKGYNDALLTNGGGGIANGIDAGAAGYLTAENCIFTSNRSAKHDGAINNDNGNITLTNCTFTKNTAVNRGGAVGNNYGDNMVITNCTFSENSAGSAGALYIRADSVNNIITDCTFSNNSATSGSGDGGAIIGDQNVTINKCIFDQNTAVRDGTFATRGDKTAVFTNCIFSKNKVLNGGAIAVNGTGAIGTLKVINCTIADNTLKTDGKGGAIYTEAAGGTVFEVANCILWGNGGNAIDRSGTTQLLPTVTYTDFAQTDYAGINNNNINKDPLFVGSGNYQLQAASPCIDNGTSTGAPEDDIEGTLRPQNGNDIGAYEYPLSSITTSASSSSSSSSTSSTVALATTTTSTTSSSSSSSSSSGRATTTTALPTTSTTTAIEPPPVTSTTTAVAPPPVTTTTTAGMQNCTDSDNDSYFAEGGECGEKDCNDNDKAISPAANEICDDGKDNDCDGAFDEDCGVTCQIKTFFPQNIKKSDGGSIYFIIYGGTSCKIGLGLGQMLSSTVEFQGPGGGSDIKSLASIAAGNIVIGLLQIDSKAMPGVYYVYINSKKIDVSGVSLTMME